MARTCVIEESIISTDHQGKHQSFIHNLVPNRFLNNQHPSIFSAEAYQTDPWMYTSTHNVVIYQAEHLHRYKH